MLAKLSANLFARIYAWVVVAVIVAVWLTKLILDKYYNDDEHIYFMATSSYLHQQLEANLRPEQSVLVNGYQLVRIPELYAEDFVAFWLEPAVDLSTICHGCQPINNATVNSDIDVQFFSDDSNDGMAVFHYTDVKRRLIVTDLDEVIINGGSMAVLVC